MNKELTRWDAFLHCMTYPQDFSIFWGKNGLFRRKEVEAKLTLEEAKAQVNEIIGYYAELIASGNSISKLLFFDIAFDITEYRGGYLIQPCWANAAYQAAKESRQVYLKLIDVVSVNTSLGIAMPSILYKFTAEVLDKSFPEPKKPGPNADATELRDCAIFESVSLLCDCVGIEFKTTSSSEKPTALQIVYDAFQTADFGDERSVAKPTKNAISHVWFRNDRQELREQILTFHWAVRHHEFNGWFRAFKPKMIETKITNYLCTCFHWRR